MAGGARARGPAIPQKDQEQAEQDLQDVLDNLDQAQKEIQQQQNKEKLFQIEQELKKMLEIQNDVSKRTKDADKLQDGRPKKLTMIQVFKSQLELADSTKVIVKKRGGAGVSVRVAGIRRRHDRNRDAPDKENAGTGTRKSGRYQEDRELIEALRRRPEPKKGGGGGGSGSKPPLVPSLAQMKMLRIMQRDVNSRVKKLDKSASQEPGYEQGPDGPPTAHRRSAGQDCAGDAKDGRRAGG